MKRLVLILLLAAPALHAQDFSPAPVDVERYRALWERSPFVLPARAAAPVSALAQRFTLTGVAFLADDPIVFLLDRQSSARLMLRLNDPQNGLLLVSVENSSDPKQASALIRLGSEQAVVRYDPSALQAPAAPPSATQTAQAGTAPQESPAVAQNAPANGEPPPAARTLKRRPIIRIVK